MAFDTAIFTSFWTSNWFWLCFDGNEAENSDSRKCRITNWSCLALLDEGGLPGLVFHQLEVISGSLCLLEVVWSSKHRPPVQGHTDRGTRELSTLSCGVSRCLHMVLAATVTRLCCSAQPWRPALQLWQVLSCLPHSTFQCLLGQRVPLSFSSFHEGLGFTSSV